MKKPLSATVFPWLKANLGPHCLAPLTSTDIEALRAAVQIVGLYCYHQTPAILSAFSNVVRAMQPSTMELAYHAIAHVLDWPDRSEIWRAAELPNFNIQRRCNFEPKGAL